MDNFIKAFILGLSISPVCLFTCTPLVVPYVLSEGRGFLRTLYVSAIFLAGRFVGYMFVGAFAWYVSRKIFENAVARNIISGAALFVLAAILIRQSAFQPKTNACGCGAAPANPEIENGGFSKTAFGLGFLTAFNICPPILIAIFEAATKKGILSAMAFYFSFFSGSSVYFAAVPFLGICRGKLAVNIGKTCAILIGSYYLHQGTFKLVSGLMLAMKK